MNPAAGHTPVLRAQVTGLLGVAGRRVLMDCTVGLGGHAESLLEAAGTEACLIGMDVDEANLVLARQRLSRFPNVRLFQANFSQAHEVLAEVGVPAVDALLVDLGVSSTQLDDPSRGLSYSMDGPLDMRLDKRLDQTAADLVNRMGEEELANVIFEYGQERYSRRIARAVVQARRTAPILRTRQLSDLVSRAMPAAVRATRQGVHPATRTFQALRIAVNDEMGVLEKLLAELPRLLAHGGRAAFISFHSLEDGRVKRAFADWARTEEARLLTKKPLTADGAETEANPRSRSAKLRGIERI